MSGLRAPKGLSALSLGGGGDDDEASSGVRSFKLSKGEFASKLRKMSAGYDDESISEDIQEGSTDSIEQGLANMNMKGAQLGMNLQMNMSMGNTFNGGDSLVVSNEGTFMFKQAGTKVAINDKGMELRSTFQGVLTFPGVLLPSPSDVGDSLGMKMSVNDFVFIGDLGKGASANVKRAIHMPTMKLVAVKMLKIYDKSVRGQFKSELLALLKQSPNLMNMLGVYFSEGYVTMVLEYMNRGDLQSVIAKYGVMPEDVIRPIARQVLLGLQAMKALHLVHRDLKPGNILCDNKGNVKLSDFGFTKQLDGTDFMTSTGVGTTVYLSPERVRSEAYAFPADIWSVGVTLFYMATGSMPIPSEFFKLLHFMSNPEEEPVLNLDPKKFSAEFRDFVKQMLRKDPKQRGTPENLLKHPFLKPLNDGTGGSQPSPSNASPVESKEDNAPPGAVRKKVNPAGGKKKDEGPALFPWCAQYFPSNETMEEITGEMKSTVWADKKSWSMADVALLHTVAEQMGVDWETFKSAFEKAFAIRIENGQAKPVK